MHSEDDKSPPSPGHLTPNGDVELTNNTTAVDETLSKELDNVDSRDVVKRDKENFKSLRINTAEMLNISYPTNFEHVMHVGVDPVTGEYEGMPQKWLKKLERSKSAINTTPVFNISGPTNIKHTLHIGFDPVSGEFMGFPKEWSDSMVNSDISKQEEKNTPQPMSDAQNMSEETTATRASSSLNNASISRPNSTTATKTESTSQSNSNPAIVTNNMAAVERPLSKELDEVDKAKNAVKFKSESNKLSTFISYPKDMKHVHHVDFDPVTRKFTGMPKSWRSMIMNSDITKEKQTALDVGNNSKEEPMTEAKTLNISGSSSCPTLNSTTSTTEAEGPIQLSPNPVRVSCSQIEGEAPPPYNTCF